jgi:hypothetical protein
MQRAAGQVRRCERKPKPPNICTGMNLHVSNKIHDALQYGAVARPQWALSAKMQLLFRAAGYRHTGGGSCVFHLNFLSDVASGGAWQAPMRGQHAVGAARWSGTASAAHEASPIATSSLTSSPSLLKSALRMDGDTMMSFLENWSTRELARTTSALRRVAGRLAAARVTRDAVSCMVAGVVLVQPGECAGQSSYGTGRDREAEVGRCESNVRSVRERRTT